MNFLEEEISRLEKKIAEAKLLLADPGLSAMACEEIEKLEAEKMVLKASVEQIEPKADLNFEESQDKFDLKSATIEVRGATGGNEAKIWADDLLRMYSRFALLQNFKIETLEEGVILVKGRGAFGKFKHEGGVHRVQRVPETEAAGRIHTSTATVAVLPELGEIDFKINLEDIKFEAFRSGGHGGQNVNKVSSAVRLTHLPTGLVVVSQEERDQWQNRERAFSRLRAILWEKEEEKRLTEVGSLRANQVGKGTRAEKIRTYNFPQNRVTDHRIGRSWHNLDQIMEGKLEEIIETLTLAES